MTNENSAISTTNDQVPAEREPQKAQGQVAGSMKYCHGCGNQLHASAQSCPGCGASMRKKGGKTKVGAALFAFFLGGFGAHRFYVGNVGLGILYLLFCWTFIPAIVAFFEFIYFLAMDENTFDEKYN
ncbi:NINE protein [Kushneria sp. AK178]